MTEIENIKKQTLASFIKDSLEKDAKIASLITTIESQTKQFEELKLHAEHLQALVDGQDQSHTEYVNETETLIEQKDALIESQKEEMESKDNFFKGYDHQSRLIESQLRTEIESLKAITELAVKGLKDCLELGECQLDYGGSIDCLEQVANISLTTLAEIERLSQ